MNEFLSKVFFDNTVRQYCIVLAVIIFVLFTNRYIAHYLAGVLFRVIRLRWKTIDKVSFKNLLAKPLGLFLAVLIIVAALDTLKFPKELNFSIYHISIKEILAMAGTGAIIVTFFEFLIKCMDFIGLMVKEHYAGDEHRAKSQIIFFFKDFIKVLLGVIAVLLILKYCFHYDVKGLVTGLSLVGAAIALALKENLENLIASFVIFFDKPFTTGDVVKVNNVSGTVEKIGLRSTRIRSDEKTYITVPNKQMADSILDNLSDRLQRHYILKLELDTDTPFQKIEELLNGLNDIVKKGSVQTATVFLNEITSTAIVVSTEIFTATIPMADFNTLKQTINIEALQLLEKLGIEIAGKSTDVNITTRKPIQPPPTKIL
ncbi:MAG: mechanosensitive ion channel family protein [Niabella sp.]